MKKMSVVNSIASYKDKIYLQSRFENGLEVYDFNGKRLDNINIDSYFGWTLRVYGNKLFYGTTSNSIKIFDLDENRVIQEIKPKWKILNNESNFDGRYTTPTGFAVYEDLLYVVDTHKNEILILDFEGNLLNKVNINELIDFNTIIVRIDVSKNYIGITSVEQNAILLFNKEFKFLKKIKSTGSLEGEFEIPWEIQFVDEYIFISDLYNHRIQIFDLELGFIKSIGKWGYKLGEFNYVYGTFILNDYALFADTWNHGFQIWERDKLNFKPLIAVKEPRLEQVLRPSRINNIDDNIVVSDYLNHCFKFFSKNLDYLHKIGNLGFMIGEYRYVSGITKLNKDFFCVDTRSGRVTKISDEKKNVYEFVKGHDGSHMGPNSDTFFENANNKTELSLCSDICNDGEYIYVADISYKAIFKFDLEGKLINTIGKEIFEVNYKTEFIGCEIFDNLLYATNPGKNTILIFNLEGKLLNELTELELNSPTGISINQKFIAISNRLNHEVLIIDKRTNLVIKRIGKLGNNIEEFCAPWDVLLFEEDLYVADSLNNRIQKINIGELYE